MNDHTPSYTIRLRRRLQCGRGLLAAEGADLNTLAPQSANFNVAACIRGRKILTTVSVDGDIVNAPQSAYNGST